MIWHSGGQRLVFAKRVIRKTIQPPLTLLRRGDHRMSGRVCVFARMPVWRAIAAERDATFLARAQMDPV